jgi:hypothetical protein
LFISISVENAASGSRHAGGAKFARFASGIKAAAIVKSDREKKARETQKKKSQTISTDRLHNSPRP